MSQRLHLPASVVANGFPRAAQIRRKSLDYAALIRRRWSHHPRLFVWQLLWLPYWLGSDRPVPSLPGPSGPGQRSDRAISEPAAAWFRSSMVSLVRSFQVAWIIASALRGAWLALLASFFWMLLVNVGIASVPGITIISVFVVVAVVIGLAFALLNAPNPTTVAVMLDRTFRLQERLTTACDAIYPPGERAADHVLVPRLQMADAANALDEVRKDLARSRFVPVREVVGVLIAGMALLAAVFAHVPDHPLPAISESPIPAFVPASQRLSDPQIADPQSVAPPKVAESPPSVAEVQERARSSQASRDDLGTIGKALEDNQTTQPAADAIANGDYASAADAIRAAANQAPAMSQEAREALADQLDTAAGQVSAENPDLAQASRDAADGLRRGGDQSTTGLNDLADQVQQTGSSVVPQEQLEQNLQAAQAGAAGSPSSPGTGQQDSGNQQSQNANGKPGQPGQAGLSDPGQGVAAKPGVSDQEQQASDSRPTSSQAGNQQGGGQSQAGAGSAPEGSNGQAAQNPSSDGAPSSGSTSGQESANSSGSTSPGGGDSQGLTGNPDEETRSSQGSGAGTGQSGANDKPEGNQSVDSPASANTFDPNAEVPSNGAAGNPPPSGNGQPGSAGDSGTVSNGSTSLVLVGTSDNGVQTGSDSGSSSLGSGSGVGTASGNQVQAEVGVAGPDSNRVPEDKRDIVKDYFSGPEAAP